MGERLVDERVLRDELERLQVHARGLRDELSGPASPAFLARRAALTQELERRQQRLVERAAVAERVEAELRPVSEKVARLRAELTHAEQRRLPGWLVLTPVAFLALAATFLEGSSSGAWFVGATSAALFGGLLGLSFARPAAQPAPLTPTLTADVLFNPAAWALAVLVPVMLAVGVSLELVPGVRWLADAPLVELLPETLALGLASLSTALAARRALTKTGRVALGLAVALTFLLAVIGHRAITLLGPDVTTLTWLGARAALLVPVVTAAMVVATSLFSLRRAALTVAAVAAVLSLTTSVFLGRAGAPTKAADSGLLGFVAVERTEVLDAEEALRGTGRQLDRERRTSRHAGAGDAPSPGVREMLVDFEVRHREQLLTARARLADDMTLLVLSFSLALLALFTTWAPRRVWWAWRAAAVLPLVVLLAAVNLRNV